MPKLGLGLSLPQTRVSGSAAPLIPPDGLSLWLKADAGVTTVSYTYKSNIALSEAGQTTINGNYAPSSTPVINSNYMLVGPNSNFIEVRPNSSPVYRLFNENNNIDGGPSYYDFTSSNGTTWSFGDGKRPVSITISGLTGASAQANGIYNSFVGTIDGGITNWIAYETISGLGVLKVYQNGDCELFRIISENFTLIATGSNWGIGSFTIVSPATGSPTGSGTIYPTGGVPTGVVTTTTVSTSDVTAWADQSGNANNATPFDANPTYNSSDLNSKPTISLSSIGDEINKSFLINGDPMGASGTTAFAVVYVQDVCDATNDNGPIFGDFGIVNSSSHYPYGGDCSVYDGFASEDRKGPLTAPSTITNSWSLYSVVSTENDWRDYVNGALMHSDNTNVYSNGAYDGNLYIGFSSFGYTLKGKIAEAIMYNRVLTTPERLQVEAYLMDKYAISPAPSGIPVASTNQIVVTNAGLFNGTYTRRSAGANLTIPYGLLEGTGNSYSISEGGTDVFVLIGPQMTVGGYGTGSWVFAYGYNDDDVGNIVFGALSPITNASTDITTLPTTGWSSGITITAA